MVDVEYPYGNVFLSSRKLRDMGTEMYSDEFYRAINQEKEVEFTVDWCSETDEYRVLFMPAYRLGSEWVKTLGVVHDHDEELNIVTGTAHLLIQHLDGEVVTSFDRIELERNEIYTVPKGCYHVIVNPSLSESLIVLMKRHINTESECELTVRKKGMAYYELINGGFVWNTEYGPEAEKPLVSLLDPYVT